MKQPSYLESAPNAVQALYSYFNVRDTPTPTGSALGPTFDMYVVRDARMPTHLLAATQSDQDPDNTTPLMLPIDLTLFERGFRTDLNVPPAAPGSIAPIPRSLTVGDSQVLYVNLPVVPIRVPHVPSLALLLLFAMGLETNHNLLAWKLLPVDVVGEFPNAAAMSTILSRRSHAEVDTFHRHNHGLWKNILALALSNSRMIQAVQTALHVTNEARRLQLRTKLAQQS
ncbi:hypothetical protein JR316_0013171 [Psilocybe cubensis]|uniref:Uncharacterized protein n=2 Tax=Psilocybe cubensis TaxID=181762 RepID=A0A8H8CI36_PSICU|nr:hypothetical protein JR316_0013171 [Psilocybe cubensis]KAH9474706.1 hypothetical protein JR316_0013171 [Psilocybe cubensis]